MNQKDPLTGVYTRASFLALADEMIRQHPEKQYDIVLSDFVGFKYFNERYGIPMGDLLLIRTGSMLSTMASGTLCGRYGGDRFVSLVEHLPPQAVAFLDHFQLPAEAKDELPVFSIVVKFGICPISDNGIPSSVFCDRAMLAVESVKHIYGKNVAVYDDSVGTARLNEILIEENMKSALDEHQFEVYYQPKVDVKTGELCGAEALVRWNHPTMGFMNPGIFIPLFEKNGFITELDIYIWEKVCQDMSEWRSKGKKLFPVSVNVSRKDFNRPQLPEIIVQIVDAYQIDHSLLHLEVTESSYSDDPATIVRSVDQLSAAGMIIELDDFGTGYTSLSCLNELHIDIIKFDMSLLKKDQTTTNKTGILSFAMNIAKLMHITTVQEGVETEADVAKIKTLGTDIAQGYYYARPLPKAAFEQWVDAHQGGCSQAPFCKNTR